MEGNSVFESIVSKHADPLYFYTSAPRNAKIAIYGTGKAGQSFHNFIKTFRPDITVIFYVDSFSTGMKNGLQVVKVDQLGGRSDYDFIVICSVAYREIEGILHFFNQSRHVVIGQSAKYSSRYFARNKSNFDNVAAMLHTEQDRDIYKLLLDYSSDYELLHKSPDIFCEKIDAIKEKNWYIDFINMDKVRTAVDAGAYNGDSAIHFEKSFSNLQKLYCFEISYPKDTFYKVNQNFIGDSRIEFHGMGLSDEDGDQYILRGRYHTISCGDSLSKDSTDCERVTCTTLDSFCKKNDINQIDYIKMDIEGAEHEALNGCKGTIEKCRPQMAICIYHDLDDMWSVPLLLNKLCSNYVYRLNQYSSHLNETVMYAIPRELYIEE